MAASAVRERAPPRRPSLRLTVGDGRTGATPDLPKLVGYPPQIGVWSLQGRYRPLLLESLAQAPPGNTCLSLTSRAVSSKATETPFTSWTRPHLRGSW